MSESGSGLRLRDAPPVAYAPALALVVAAPLLMSTRSYVDLGFLSIVASFAAGVPLAILAEVLSALSVTSARTASAGLALGASLTVAAIVLYLVFGCVFGCPG